ncbi:MAG TPA: RNA-binding protein [Clostridiales bacterium]|nr:MAG: RNA-binding protein [Clostridiales bacterium GWD2_32_19]HCC06877.1 RNA-binding protein [Clostridiales bacterium]
MIELGKMQYLKIDKMGPIGLLLISEDNSREDVLLPAEQVPTGGVQVGDEIEVFVYKDTNDDLTATTQKPKLEVGEIDYLNVVDLTQVGAFLDWGLKKDLFIPYTEQKGKLVKNEKYLVGLYIDKSDRICATMYIDNVLKSDSPYQKNDKAEGFIYDIKEDMGAFVAVDRKYHGLIPKSELYKYYSLGDEVEVRITNVREDGKLDLSLREKAYLQMDMDAETIMERLNNNDGILNLNDNSSPENIKLQLNISKKAFKRAVGTLLKNGKIEFVDDGIKLV